jgi:TRAP transporter TAXI family solute receptor
MWSRYNKIRYAAGGIDWREIGYVLGKNLAQYDYDVEVLASGTDMSISNPKMVSKGEAEIGINRNVIINWAIKGIEPFKEKLDNLQGVATIPSISSHTFGMAPVLKADLEINSYEDLVEKKYPLKLKSTHYKTHVHGITFGQVLKEYGSSWEELFSWGGKQIVGPDGYVPELNKPEQIIEAMKKGELDGGWGIPGIWKVAEKIKLKFLSLNKEVAENLRQKYGHLIVNVGSNALYEGQEEYVTWGYPGQFIFTHKDVPDDCIFKLAKVINENSIELSWCQPGLVGVPGRMLVNMWGIPMHKGAQKYYKSIGWL